MWGRRGLTDQRGALRVLDVDYLEQLANSSKTML